MLAIIEIQGFFLVIPVGCACVCQRSPCHILPFQHDYMQHMQRTPVGGQLDRIMHKIVYVISSAPMSQAVHPDGSCIVTGGRRGALHRWSLPATADHNTADSGTAAAEGAGTAAASGAGAAATGCAAAAPPDLWQACEPLHLQGGGHTDTIDRMVRRHSGQKPLENHAACLWSSWIHAPIDSFD